MARRLSFRHLLTPGGLEPDRTIVIADDGTIEAIERISGTPSYDGFLALPGMPNAHSHVFQRALAGFGEAAAAGEDSFWSWREAMYRLANALSPDDLYAVARYAFSEMLRAGFTRVAEFHYVHHRREGGRGVEMAGAVLEAAESIGLPLLFLPVFYRRGGFGAPTRPEQRRFIHETVDDFLWLLDRCLAGRRAGRHASPDLVFGVAPHSLRAVPVEEIGELLEGAETLLGDGFPVQIHVSEQRGEVEECRAALGTTPIQALASRVEIGPRWSLVHATHATPEELQLVRRADATVVLCPLTEAYLGDGLFPAAEHVSAGGRFAVGSDSNVRIDAVGELRWLEFGQRLRAERRARLATEEGLGAPLWRGAAAGGAHAMGIACGALEPGRRADFVVLGEEDAALAGHGADTLLDAWVVGGDRTAIEAVYVGGRRVVERGEAVGAEGAKAAFAEVVAHLPAL